MPRPMIAGVIRGSPIREVVEVQVALYRLERVEKLFLTVEAAIRMVAFVGVELDLVGGDLDQAHSQLTCDRSRLVLLGLGVGWRARERCDRAFAKLVESELQQQRRVDAARIRDEHRAEIAHDAARLRKPGRVMPVELDHSSGLSPLDGSQVEAGDR